MQVVPDVHEEGDEVVFEKLWLFFLEFIDETGENVFTNYYKCKLSSSLLYFIDLTCS